MPKSNWKNSYEYKRIMEILEAYWLSEPDEDKVRIRMDFIKGDECQSKCITWVNPKNKKYSNESPKIISAAELLNKSSYEIYEEEERKFWGDLYERRTR